MASSSSVFELIDTEGGPRNDGPYLKGTTEWFHPYARSSAASGAEKEPSSAPPKGAGDSAAWRLYNKAAKEVDEKLVKDWNSKLGGILLFAALFAAVVTTLLVDTMTLLEPPPLDKTEQFLYFLAKQTVSHADHLPLELEPSYTYVFTRPHWAFVINGLLVSSLSFSVLVALGAVICLEWVNEYEASSRAISTPEKQALRRHYRFRAVRKWHMARLIGALPFMMFLVVMLFFVALIMWLWRIDRFLALLPLLGVSITGAAHLLTTTLAVFFPSAPFKTSISEAIFRIFTFCNVLFTFLSTALPIWFKFGLKRLKVRLYGQPTEVCRSSYGMSWANAMNGWNDRIYKAHPWLPRSLQLTDAITMSRREDDAVKTDGTLQLSALAWLAGSLDFTPDSYEELVDILREINKLKESQLHGWGPFEYEAPWNDMFRVVLSCSPADAVANGEHAEMESILASLLQKMLVNQPLFSRVVKDIDQPSLINAFLESLAKAEPTSEPETRLRGMTIILSSLGSGNHHRTKWHLRAIFKILSDNIQTRGERMDADFTSWIFPLCGHNGRTCDDHDPNWPDPSYIDFTETFSWRRCRVDAIFRFMRLIDRIEQEENTSTEDIRLMFGLLIDHILAIHWALEAPAFVRVERPLLLGSRGFKNPALDLIVSTMTRPVAYVPWPSEPLSAQWHYAVKYWCRWKQQVGSGFSTEEGHVELDFLCRIWEQKDESLFAESMDMLDGNASILLPREWTLIFDNLTKTGSSTPKRAARILVLFEQALQSLTEQGPSFRAFLRSHMQPSGSRARPVEYSPLLPPPHTPTSPVIPRKRWSGSSHRYPPRHNSGNSALNEPSFRLASLLQFIVQSLGDHGLDNSEQHSLRSVCARIVGSVVNLVDRLEPDEVTLLGDFQNYLEISDPQRGDPAVQTCISEIRSKLRSLVDSDGAITLGRQNSSSLSARISGKIRGRQAGHALPVVPEVYIDHTEVPRTTEAHEPLLSRSGMKPENEGRVQGAP